jgi:hypothetical protein
MADDRVESDRHILEHIEHLVAEEHQLQQAQTLPNAERTRLMNLRIELDQCWDLLRQRRAKREFGQNPGDAAVRAPRVVEGYEG